MIQYGLDNRGDDVSDLQHQFNDLKISAALMIQKRMVNDVDTSEYVREISTYINQVDKLYIYNFTNQELDEFYEKLKKYDNVFYTDCEDYGEVANYQMICENFIEEDVDFGVVMQQGYYYEEGAFLALRRYAIENDTSKVAVITPMPLRGCEIFSRQQEEARKCMGCNLVGALINLKIFKETGGFKLEYYQSMFDYEYCLKTRSLGYSIMLLQNQVLRNSNYKVLERRVFFIKLQTFDYDLRDLYYQTRNRFYLWDEYKNIDKEYVKLDKKLYKQERHTIRIRDSHYRDKFYLMEEAKFDYLKKKKGKYNSGGEKNEN